MFLPRVSGKGNFLWVVSMALRRSRLRFSSAVQRKLTLGTNRQYLKAEKRRSEGGGDKRRSLPRPDIPAGANEEGGIQVVFEDLGVDIAIQVNSEDESGGINLVKGGGGLDNLVTQGGDELNVGLVEIGFLEDDFNFVFAQFL